MPPKTRSQLVIGIPNLPIPSFKFLQSNTPGTTPGPPLSPTVTQRSDTFAFWLRSSVVSVLSSLIARTFLREFTIILIFATGQWLTGLAHSHWHCVVPLTLPGIHALSLAELPESNTRVEVFL
ncbi:hypothetical protein HBI06_147610 [Parastagonospora nodorum]|nr:hypothetical protein HBI06_147610 [Parastagonospora nodorum]